MEHLATILQVIGPSGFWGLLLLFFSLGGSNLIFMFLVLRGVNKWASDEAIRSQEFRSEIRSALDKLGEIFQDALENLQRELREGRLESARLEERIRAEHKEQLEVSRTGFQRVEQALSRTEGRIELLATEVRIVEDKQNKLYQEVQYSKNGATKTRK